MKNLLKAPIALTLATAFLLSSCETTDEVLAYEKLSIKTDYKFSHINSSLFTDDALYFTCYTSSYKDRNPDDIDYHTDRRRIIKMDFSGNSEQLPDYNDMLSDFVNILFVDENKNLYAMNTITLLDEAGDMAGYESTISKLDPNGALTEKRPLTEEDKFIGMCVDKDGYVYTHALDSVSIYNPSLEKISEIDLKLEDVYNIFSINDSRVICMMWIAGDVHLLTIDKENHCVKEEFIIENSNDVHKGNSEYDIIYYSYKDNKIYAQNLGKTPKELVCLTDYGLEVLGITNLKLTESGDVIIVCDTGYEWPDGEKTKGGVSDVVILKRS